MAFGLDLEKRPRRPQLGCDPAEFTVEGFRLPHRHSGPQLLPAGIGELDEFVQGTLGYTHRDGTVDHRKDLPHSLIERSRQARHAVREIEEIRRRDHRLPECDVMAPGTLEPCGVPNLATTSFPLVGK
jgi:hypothetical protein